MIFMLFISLLCQNLNGHQRQDSTLVFYPIAMRDSIMILLHSEKDSWDSTLINRLEILSKPQKPSRSPDVEFTLMKNERVAVLLLDSKKQFIKLVLLKEMEKGQYKLFLNSQQIHDILESRRANNKPFYVLWISDHKSGFQKGVLLR